jgi:hypothetical protein
MYERLKAKKKELIILGGLVALGLLMVALNSIFQPKLPFTTPPEQKSPLLTPEPEEVQYIPSLAPETPELQVLSVEPDPLNGGPYGANQAFTVTFNDDVVARNLLINSRDNFPIDIEQGERNDTVVIKPANYWNANRDYSIIIYADTQGVSGKTLKKPHEFIFRVGRDGGDDHGR